MPVFFEPLSVRHRNVLPPIANLLGKLLSQFGSQRSERGGCTAVETKCILIHRNIDVCGSNNVERLTDVRNPPEAPRSEPVQKHDHDDEYRDRALPESARVQSALESAGNLQ